MSTLRQTLGNTRILTTKGNTWISTPGKPILAKYQDNPRLLGPANDMTAQQFEAAWANATESHKLKPGTHLLLQLPFAEGLHEDEHKPFMPGITGTVKCWVIGQEPYVPDQHGYLAEPEYIICPHREPNMNVFNKTMWEDFAEDEQYLMDNPAQGLMSPPGSKEWLITLKRIKANVERNMPESLLMNFVVDGG